MKTETLSRLRPLVTNEVGERLLQPGLGVFLFGERISPYTKSPAMWNAVFNQNDIQAHYQAIDIPNSAEVEKIVELLAEDKQFAGTNVGKPYKATVFEIVKRKGRIDPFAATVGAINTVVNENGVLVGYNTDAKGEIENLRAVIPTFAGLSVLVLGAGGGAQGVITALLEEGVAKIVVANRSLKNAQEVRDRLIRHYGNKIEVIPEADVPQTAASGEFGLILNTSSKGQATTSEEHHSSLAQGSEFLDSTTNLERSLQALTQLKRTNPHTVIADIIYNPPKSPLLQQAEDLGFVTNNGMMMLVHQAALAFQLMFSKTHDISYEDIVSTMRDAFIASLQ